MTTDRDQLPDRRDPLLEAVQELLREAGPLRAEVRALRRRNRQLWGTVAFAVAIGAGVMWDSRHQLAESNRRWCPVAQAIEARPGDPPPAGDADQRARAQAIRDFFTESAREWC